MTSPGLLGQLGSLAKQQLNRGLRALVLALVALGLFCLGALFAVLALYLALSQAVGLVWAAALMALALMALAGVLVWVQGRRKPAPPRPEVQALVPALGLAFSLAYLAARKLRKAPHRPG